MEQFLLSYWWVLLLAVILVAALLRSLVKLIITAIAIIAIFVLFWQLFVADGFTKSNQCLTAATAAANENFVKTQTMQPGKVRNTYICTQDDLVFQELIKCFRASKLENGLSFTIYSSLPAYNKTINEHVASHNTSCPDNPEVLPNL